MDQWVGGWVAGRTTQTDSNKGSVTKREAGLQHYRTLSVTLNIQIPTMEGSRFVSSLEGFNSKIQVTEEGKKNSKPEERKWKLLKAQKIFSLNSREKMSCGEWEWTEPQQTVTITKDLTCMLSESKDTGSKRVREEG